MVAKFQDEIDDDHYDAGVSLTAAVQDDSSSDEEVIKVSQSVAKVRN